MEWSNMEGKSETLFLLSLGDLKEKEE